MIAEDKEFKRRYPQIYNLFQTAKFHRLHYKELHALIQQLYGCGAMDLNKEQAEELMHRIHYASPRKT